MSENIFKCEFCGEDKYTSAPQLRGHKIHCAARKAAAKAIEAVLEEPKEAPARREKRTPFGKLNQALASVVKDPQYYYRIFNDNWRKEPGRIQRAEAAGYSKVDHSITGKAVGTNDDGSVIKSVLMRIPMEFHEEDVARQTASLDEIDYLIKHGSYQEGRNDKRYIPAQGISIKADR